MFIFVLYYYYVVIKYVYSSGCMKNSFNNNHTFSIFVDHLLQEMNTKNRKIRLYGVYFCQNQYIHET